MSKQKKPASRKSFFDDAEKATFLELVDLQEKVLHNSTKTFPNAVAEKETQLQDRLVDTTYMLKRELEKTEEAENQLAEAHQFLEDFAKFEATHLKKYDEIMAALRPYRDQEPLTP
jgi:hypothetical protein